MSVSAVLICMICYECESSPDVYVMSERAVLICMICYECERSSDML